MWFENNIPIDLLDDTGTQAAAPIITVLLKHSTFVFDWQEIRETYQPPQKKVVTSRNLDLAIQELMDYVIRDYVFSWYQTLGKDGDRFKSILE